jgi:hypothetical protein
MHVRAPAWSGRRKGARLGKISRCSKLSSEGVFHVARHGLDSRTIPNVKASQQLTKTNSYGLRWCDIAILIPTQAYVKTKHLVSCLVKKSFIHKLLIFRK